MKYFYFLLILFFTGCGSTDSNESNGYYLHKNITATYFFIGQKADANNGYISNVSSAWDDNWTVHYGGIDKIDDRNKSYIYYPSFYPKENPFYVALPFNDFDKNGNKKKDLSFIPWYQKTFQSLMKNRWIKIIKDNKAAYAQIEDVGPSLEDDSEYVFGKSKPKNSFGAKAGIDVSPAVKLYLGLKDVDKVDWQFVNSDEVPNGPWKNIITTRGVTWLYKNWYHPDKNTTFYWQLTGELNTSVKVAIYDIDLFETSKDTIAKLHNNGKKVICYFSAGSYEDYREDSDKFPSSVIGKKMDGWDEEWLDIRDNRVKNIMKSRLDLAKTKGCDGVEADNVDGYSNDTGFDLTYQDQLKYNIFLAYEAHKRGLAIGLKNDLAQINDLEMYFDFVLNEECYEYNECNLLKPFYKDNKPVFEVEYNINKKDEICSQNTPFFKLIMPKNLDGSFMYTCR